MKITIAFLSALIVVCFAADSTIALQRANETGAEVWPENQNEIARAFAESTANLYDCPSPRDEDFSYQISHARVEQISSGGYNIYYRTYNDRIRYRCGCKHIDDKSFEWFFGNRFVSERRPGVVGFSRNPKADFQMLQNKFDAITGNMLFDYVIEHTQAAKNIC